MPDWQPYASRVLPNRSRSDSSNTFHVWFAFSIAAANTLRYGDPAIGSPPGLFAATWSPIDGPMSLSVALYVCDLETL